MMLRKTQRTFFLFSLLLFVFFSELLYLKSDIGLQKKLELKKDFVSLCSLPDFAINNEDRYLRHRSLYGVGEIYSIDGVLREYNKGSFVIDRGDRDE